MKKKSILILTVSICFISLFISSCKKDEGKLPNIAFKSGGNYLNHSDTVNVGDTILVGITASKAEDKDVLKTFDAYRTYDANPVSSFYSEALSGSAQDNYSKDLTIVARAVPGKELYTFSVINKDGLRNAVSLTLTVLP